jgi:hypothetical protein
MVGQCKELENTTTKPKNKENKKIVGCQEITPPSNRPLSITVESLL